MTTFGSGFFSSLTPAEIYHQLTEGRGSGPLQEAQQSLYAELPEEQDRANLITSIGDLLATGWQGTASSAAQSVTVHFREGVHANAARLDHAQDLVARQIGSFQRAANEVRPVADPPEQPLDDAVPFDNDFEKAVTAYQADAQHNIEVFRQYDGASEYNETNMPQRFHVGGRDGGSVSVKSADTIEVGDSSPRDGEPRGDVRGPGYDEPGRTAGPGGSGSGFPGVPASGGPGTVAGRPESPDGGSAWSTGSSSAGGFPASPEGYRGYPSPVPEQGAASSRGFVGGVPVSGGVSGEAGTRGGAGGFGPRGAGGAGGALLRGPGIGAGTRADEAGVRRGAMGAAAGRGGVGAAGVPMGAGRGKDDEDTAHERKVLIEADPEDTFGSEELTAPQVIGDDEYED